MNGFWCRQERDAVEVAGRDAASYLHSQLSQDVAALAVGASAWTLLLEPAGKVVVLARVARRADDEFTLDTDSGFGDVMTARLQRFKIRVAVELRPAALSVVAVRGVNERPDGALVAWGQGYDVASEPPTGVRPGTAQELLDARIAACWPAMGSEIQPGTTIPAETGVVAVAVSFTKGCYPGQELVERMDSRGAQAPRHLVVVDRSDGDVVGTELVVGGETVGRITSVGSTQALALVRRGVEVGERA